jgi:hypothetical protein
MALDRKALPIQDRQASLGILGWGIENMPAIDRCLNRSDLLATDRSPPGMNPEYFQGPIRLQKTA